MVNELADKFAIEELLRRYMIAIDQADLVALRKVFTAGGQLRSAAGSFVIDDYVKFIAEFKAVVKTTFHQLSNVLIDLNGDVATAVSYFYAVHVAPAFQPSVAFGHVDVDTDVTMAGTYEDRLVRTAEGWKLLDRYSTVRYQSWIPSTDPT